MTSFQADILIEGGKIKEIGSAQGSSNPIGALLSP